MQGAVSGYLPGSRILEKQILTEKKREGEKKTSSPNLLHCKEDEEKGGMGEGEREEKTFQEWRQG